MTELTAKLKMPPSQVQDTLNEFERIKNSFHSIESQPLIYPLPLCNNNLRYDLSEKASFSPKITVGRIEPSAVPPDIKSGLLLTERSSLIRTESVSWQDMFRDASSKASADPCFSTVFSSDILSEVNADISSSCIGAAFGVSENILIKDRPCSWREYSPVNADPISSLIKEGAVPVGYIKSDPFSINGDLTPRAVANGLPFALGTDLRGDALVGAARNGVCSIRTTYGLCSRMGLLSRAPSMQLLSIHARDIHDIAIVLSCILNGEHNDCTSYSTVLTDWFTVVDHFDITKYKLAIARNTLDMRSSPSATVAVIKAAELFSLMGGNVTDIELPFEPNHDLLSSAIIAGESRIESIASCCGYPYSDLPQEAKREILLKHLLLNDQTVLTNARRKRNLLAQNLEKVLSNIDLFICPTVYDDGSPSPVPNVVALAGICALTVPCGMTSDGNRLGLMIAGRQFSEGGTLAIGRIYQRSTVRLKGVSRRGRHSKIFSED